jgi:ceramide glucosyltransferase
MDRLSWRAYWNHQRRVALTYRVCNPVGFAGLIFTYGVTQAVIIALLNAGELVAWLLLGVVALVRSATAASLARSLRFTIPSLPIASILGSLVESVCWFLAWFQRRVVWGSRIYRVTPDGRIYLR